MGKCSGLKGGGHHRKAVDVAAGKKKLKENQRKEQIESNKRSVILKEILTASTTAIATATAAMDADIYLQVEDDCVKDHPLLCRSYFRYDNCCNRRCQFSHHYSITDALSNIVIGTNTNTSIRNTTAAAAAKDDDDDDHNNNNDTNEDYCKDNDTISALQLIPGILHNLDDEEQERKNHRNRQQRMMMRRRRRNNLIVPYDCADADADADAFPVPSGGIFEMFAFEGYHASIMNTIVSYIECDLDVIHFSESCQYMNYVIGNCQDVQVRQYQQKQRKLQHRNDLLLFEKSVSGRLRYAVMYVSDNHINHSHSNNECDNNINTSININIINNNNDNDNNKNDRHNSNNTTTANTNTSTTSKSKSTIRKEKRDEKKRIKNMKMNNSNNNSNNENGGIHNNKKKNVGDSGGSDRNRNTSRRNSSFTRQRRRPILIYDHENPNVYAAYQHTIEQQQRQRSQ